MKTGTLQQKILGRLLLYKLDFLIRVMHSVIEDNEAFIVNLQRAQWAKGINRDGSPIEPEYSASTVARKRAKGQQAGFVTLHDEGNFYANTFVQVFEHSFTLDSSDSKTQRLKNKYSELIFGLTSESKALLIAHIKPQYVTKLKHLVV